ncbi:hypothetical protein SAZ_40460 [Streptomyces noursei ZPM]|uniref:Uncharacterized protein n=1 Tax=Streptomyces noursei TaxID=1971 RepID=A0A401QR04_STRNR|nr:hypothetical protein [Streptomyces noursei]AKA07940.1 hypothetical protein SAZ_40460 [Streptomyces noursei ZPM]EXU86649.1 hypothetical protein P354_41230 [Streptomyces noursei PD-1]UWS76557.1 hypothetical protein N1H47_38110 [Streptomyces noursei]GCB87723.1 hypothetical protein SALB_00392 [Streptomyces noursei]
MQTSGEEQRGHVLLIAGARATHRRTVQVIPSANLAALTAVPVPVLLGSTQPADLVHLDGAPDQNTMLIRLRTAAAASGPLLVYLAGQLTVDRKNHRLHLAAAGSSPATTRYTALPWEWVHNELRQRRGPTTVLVDMAADKGAWTVLHELGGLPEVNAEVYGVITPPGLSGTADGISVYTQHVIDLLRSQPDRPSNARLHALAASAAPLPPGTLVLPNTAESAAPYPHDTAETQPKAPIKRLLSGDRALLPTLRRRDPEPVPTPVDPDPFPPLATSVPYEARHYADEQPQGRQEPWQAAPGPFPGTAAPGQFPGQLPGPFTEQAAHPAPLPPAAGPAPVPAQSAAPVPTAAFLTGPALPVAPEHPYAPPTPAEQQPAPHAPPPPAAQPAPPSPRALPQQLPPAAPSSAPAPAAPAEPSPAPAAVPTTAPDPRPLIWQAAQAGRHDQAAEMAASWEQQALQRYGYDSPQATQWAEIRADLARIAGRWPLATQLWVAAARTRLAHQSSDSAEVLNAARGAHYCWNQIADTEQAIENGPELINLLRQLPALDPRHVSTAQTRLQYLHQHPTGRA